MKYREGPVSEATLLDAQDLEKSAGGYSRGFVSPRESVEPSYGKVIRIQERKLMP